MTAENPKSVADVLEAAADLLEKPGAWTKYEEARDGNGDYVSANEEEACSWCIIGATARVDHAGRGLAADLFMENFLGQDPAGWNDRQDRTQAEVVAKLREAASLSRQNGEGGK